MTRPHFLPEVLKPMAIVAQGLIRLTDQRQQAHQSPLGRFPVGIQINQAGGIRQPLVIRPRVLYASASQVKIVRAC
jgi:hypothetical protein